VIIRSVVRPANNPAHSHFRSSQLHLAKGGGADGRQELPKETLATLLTSFADDIYQSISMLPAIEPVMC
jgi:hypothetical protein